MNIIIAPYKEDFFRIRPDSSLIRAISDYFIPDYVDSISVVPILCIKTHRPGKALAPRFVNRYLDGYSFGLFLYPELSDSIISNRDFVANSLDYTSIVPKEMKPLDSEFNLAASLSMQVNDEIIFRDLTLPSKESVYERISSISHYCSLRIGDFIAFELTEPISVNSDDRISINQNGERVIDLLLR